LIIDDNKEFLRLAKTTAEDLGFKAEGIDTLDRAKARLISDTEQIPVLVLLDYWLDTQLTVNTLELLELIQKKVHRSFILWSISDKKITEQENEPFIRGADAYTFVDPIKGKRDDRALKNLLEWPLLRSMESVWFGSRFWLAGESDAAKGMRDRIRAASERVRRKPAPVVVVGEKGTGRERMGWELHCLAGRQGRFIVVDATDQVEPEGGHSGSRSGGGIPRRLTIPERLFGTSVEVMVRESYFCRSAFDLSAGGTLLLANVEQFAKAYQHKIVKELEKADRDIQLVMTISSLDDNNLHEAFRAFLRDAKAVVAQSEPLRNRREDIPLLVRLMVEYLARTEDIPPGLLADVDYDALRDGYDYDWPDNLRRLHFLAQELVKSSAALFTEKGIRSLAEKPMVPALAEVSPKRVRMRQKPTREEVLAALGDAASNRTKAALLLGISRQYFYDLLADYGLADYGIEPPASGTTE
jgi:DNA-binding NtrC family response regulator